MAVGGAVCFGSSNFLGGYASRLGLRPEGVALVSHTVGVVFLLVGAAAFGLLANLSVVLSSAAFGGLASAVATVLLYRALRNGPMAINAPVTGVTSVLVAAVVGFMRGDRLTPLVLIGMVLSVFSVAASSQTAPTDSRGYARGAGLVEAMGAGIGFGLFSVQLASSPGGTIETLLMVRVFSALVLLLLVLRRVSTEKRSASWRTSTPVKSSVLRSGGRIGVFELSGNLLLTLALTKGSLAIVQSLVSLNPVVTAVLARYVSSEHLTPWQYAGAAAAVVAIPLLAIGGS